MRSRPNGRVMLAAAWSLLRTNKALFALPVLSAVFSVIAVLLVMLPGLLLVMPTTDDTPTTGAIIAMAVLGWVATFAATAVGVFFQVALIAAVFSYLDGEQVSVGSAIDLASRRLGPILAWSALAATVGVILRMVRERGILGAIASFAATIAWAVASFFVVPIIAQEGLGPVAALKRSTHLVRTTWGPSARATLRYGLILFLVMLPAFIVLALQIVTLGRPGSGELALVVLAAIYLCVVGIVFSALGAVVRGVLYRYATGRPVPGVDDASLAAALR